MSDKKNKKKKLKPGEYPTSGVNEIWDHMFKLQGMKDLFDAIPDVNERMDIINFAAGLTAKHQKELDHWKEHLTADNATEAIRKMGQESGKSQQELETLVQGLKASRASASSIAKSVRDQNVSIEELLKNFKKDFEKK